MQNKGRATLELRLARMEHREQRLDVVLPVSSVKSTFYRLMAEDGFLPTRYSDCCKLAIGVI